MIKEYCDICGKEVVTDKYFLPVVKDSYARDGHGTPMVATKVMSPEKKMCVKIVQEKYNL